MGSSGSRAQARCSVNMIILWVRVGTLYRHHPESGDGQNFPKSILGTFAGKASVLYRCRGSILLFALRARLSTRFMTKKAHP